MPALEALTVGDPVVDVVVVPSDVSFVAEVVHPGQRVGPGGHFMGEKSTRASLRSGEWLIPRLGEHGPFNAWIDAGKKDILEEAREKVETLLAAHTPLPLGYDVEDELDKIQKRAEESIG